MYICVITCLAACGDPGRFLTNADIHYITIIILHLHVLVLFASPRTSQGVVLAKNSGPFHLLGQGFGGLIALSYATTYPDFTQEKVIHGCRNNYLLVFAMPKR